MGLNVTRGGQFTYKGNKLDKWKSSTLILCPIQLKLEQGVSQHNFSTNRLWHMPFDSRLIVVVR